jgi:ribosome-associated translation inhibitor RaiA
MSTLQIQVNTDRNIEGHEALAEHVRTTVSHALRYLEDEVTRVEVHLSDGDGSKKSDNDQRCLMEARMRGRQPIAVDNRANTIQEAVNGAAGKLARAIETTVGKLRDKRN